MKPHRQPRPGSGALPSAAAAARGRTRTGRPVVGKQGQLVKSRQKRQEYSWISSPEEHPDSGNCDHRTSGEALGGGDRRLRSPESAGLFSPGKESAPGIREPSPPGLTGRIAWQSQLNPGLPGRDTFAKSGNGYVGHKNQTARYLD